MLVFLKARKKAIIALIGAISTWAPLALADNHISLLEGEALIIALLGVLGVHEVANVGTPSALLDKLVSVLNDLTSPVLVSPPATPPAAPVAQPAAASPVVPAVMDWGISQNTAGPGIPAVGTQIAPPVVTE